MRSTTHTHTEDTVSHDFHMCMHNVHVYRVDPACLDAYIHVHVHVSTLWTSNTCTLYKSPLIGICYAHEWLHVHVHTKQSVLETRQSKATTPKKYMYLYMYMCMCIIMFILMYWTCTCTCTCSSPAWGSSWFLRKKEKIRCTCGGCFVSMTAFTVHVLVHIHVHVHVHLHVHVYMYMSCTIDREIFVVKNISSVPLNIEILTREIFSASKNKNTRNIFQVE